MKTGKTNFDVTPKCFDIDIGDMLSENMGIAGKHRTLGYSTSLKSDSVSKSDIYTYIYIYIYISSMLEIWFRKLTPSSVC